MDRNEELDALIAAGLGHVPGAKLPPPPPPPPRRVAICNIVFRYEDKEPYVLSGKSLLGAIEVAPNGHMKCHECGCFHENLGRHVAGSHHLLADSYRKAHGLRRTTRLSLKKQVHVRVSPLDHNHILRPENRKKALPFLEYTRHELRNLHGRCEAQIKDTVQKLAGELGRAPTKVEFAAAKLYPQHIKTFLGVKTMAEMLVACGVSFPARSTGGQKKPINKEAKEHLAAILREKANGGTLQATDMRPPLPYPAVFQRVFGSVTNAIEYAGLEMTPYQKGRMKAVQGEESGAEE